MTDQRINSVVYVKVLSESMEILLSVCPRKKNGRPHVAQEKCLTSAGIKPATFMVTGPGQIFYSIYNVILFLQASSARKGSG